MANAKSLEGLAHPDYWDDRYQDTINSPTYEWFKSFASLESLFSKYLPEPSKDGGTPRILHLGCGNSTLPLDLHSIGYRNQVCVDFSTVVINNMATRFMAKDGIEWKVQDVRRMEDMADEDFEAAIDKGTLDAMISGSMWDPPEHVKKNTQSYIDEVSRVLKPGGVFIYITYRQPLFMKPMLRRDDVWDLVVVDLNQDAGAFEYFGFILTKK